MEQNMKIQILDINTANGIAAGEVVERPASVVKELVENSLDAGATRIKVEIEQGGIKRIRVADNGSGMSPEDAALAFKRHATSKLRTLNDLHMLSSMGFRGEALPSIAAVSKVDLLSREEDADSAYFLRLEAGEEIEEKAASSAVGTFITIEDLFFNTPARYKFLKRDSTEAAYVQDLLEKLAFSRPDVAFSLYKDGKEVLHSPGDGKLISVIYTIWGKDSAAAAIPLAGEIEGIKTEGFISKSSHARRNRARQIFIVNHRVIQSPMLKVAVDKAIQGFFVKGNFPELILNITVPAPFVDVNVHPQKIELRFADESKVFRSVYHAIRDALAASSGIKDISLLKHDKKGREANAGQISEAEAFQVQLGEAKAKQISTRELLPEKVGQSTAGQELKVEEKPRQKAFSTFTYKDEDIKEKKAFKDGDLSNPLALPYAYKTRLPAQEQAAVFAEINRFTEEKEVSDSNKKEDETSPVKEKPEPILSDNPELRELASARIIGQVFNTYLLLEGDDNLLLIDQHAAHERILFEDLREARRAEQEGSAVQLLLLPLNLKFSPLEMEKALLYAEEIRKMGFDFEEFSDTSLILRAVPKEFSNKSLDPERAFRMIVEEAAAEGLNEEARLDEKLHTVACKAAVKAHDILSYQEMKVLIKDLINLEDPFHCPHGRPVIIRFSRDELEKFFSRIV